MEYGIKVDSTENNTLGVITVRPDEELQYIVDKLLPDEAGQPFASWDARVPLDNMQRAGQVLITASLADRLPADAEGFLHGTVMEPQHPLYTRANDADRTLVLSSGINSLLARDRSPAAVYAATTGAILLGMVDTAVLFLETPGKELPGGLAVVAEQINDTATLAVRAKIRRAPVCIQINTQPNPPNARSRASLTITGSQTTNGNNDIGVHLPGLIRAADCYMRACTPQLQT